MNCASYLSIATALFHKLRTSATLVTHQNVNVRKPRLQPYLLFFIYTRPFQLTIPRIMLLSRCSVSSLPSYLGLISDETGRPGTENHTNNIQHYYFIQCFLLGSPVIYISLNYTLTSLLTRFIPTPTISLPIIPCVIQDVLMRNHILLLLTHSR